MVSRSGLSGNAGKGLCSGWITSGGLGGTTRSNPTCDWVSGASNCEWCDSGGSDDDCCVSAESEVSSMGLVRRDGGQDRVMRLGAVMAAWGCLLRCSL